MSYEEFRTPLPRGFLDISFERIGREVVSMKVQYTAIHGEDHVDIVRYDTSHGYLHKHTWPGGTEHIVDLESPTHPRGEYAAALTAAIEDLKINWKTYLSQTLGKTA